MYLLVIYVPVYHQTNKLPYEALAVWGQSSIITFMRYPWTFFTILGIWIAIAPLIGSDVELNASMLYFVGVVITVAIAIIGFKSPV